MWFQQTVVTACNVHSLKIVKNIIIIVNNINFTEHKEKQQQQALPLPSSSSTSHTASPSYSPVSPLSILISRVFPPFPFSFPFSSSSALPHPPLPFPQYFSSFASTFSCFSILVASYQEAGQVSERCRNLNGGGNFR